MLSKKKLLVIGCKCYSECNFYRSGGTMDFYKHLSLSLIKPAASRL